MLKDDIYAKVLVVHFYYCFKMALSLKLCDIGCMILLHQLLVNFLVVCAHLIAILLWHFVFEILFACGGGTCVMIQAYDTVL